MAEPRLFCEETCEPPPPGSSVPALFASVCTACGRRSFPVKERCPQCLGATERLQLCGRGVLYSYSIVHVAPPEFRVPYVIGYVDTPERVRVFAQIDAPEFELLRPGLPVEVTYGQIRTDFDVPDGVPVFGYRFKPAEASA
jgi:uncharacterized OB-fold protein